MHQLPSHFGLDSHEVHYFYNFSNNTKNVGRKGSYCMVQSTSYSMVQAFIEKLIVANLLKKSLAVIDSFFSETV
jgi:hypothetical protein